ncbi:hypothetical protein AA100600_0135 [Gluconobacter thailandicus F149-1 = NBRC 100600]|nr:hypothetical protein AA100600_0135 [Gluconobacter thailandicus F149-1 = NBRC 100600]
MSPISVSPTEIGKAFFTPIRSTIIPKRNDVKAAGTEKKDRLVPMGPGETCLASAMALMNGTTSPTTAIETAE